jgi:hypothetical protein
LPLAIHRTLHVESFYSQPQSADTVTVYIEANAPGTKKGLRWQRNWQATYCIVIENRVVNDNFKV